VAKHLRPETVIDLVAATHHVTPHIKDCLTDFARHGGKAELLFYHTHPNYGQVHIYLSRNIDAEPYDDLVGVEPIGYVLDFEGWSERDDWGEDDPFHPVLKLATGEIIRALDNCDFNKRWGEHLDRILKDCIPSFAPELRPSRVIVQSENGEYVSDWRTNRA
jgi:hypothetical protein